MTQILEFFNSYSSTKLTPWKYSSSGVVPKKFEERFKLFGGSLLVGGGGGTSEMGLTQFSTSGGGLHTFSST